MQSDSKISEDRREALRYALALGSGAALVSAMASPASAQASADNTLDRVRANKVMRIAVLRSAARHLVAQLRVREPPHRRRDR